MTTPPSPPERPTEPQPSQPFPDAGSPPTRTPAPRAPSTPAEASANRTNPDKPSIPRPADTDVPVDTVDLPFAPRRRRVVPLLLFLATCLSTFWVGAARFRPIDAAETWGTIQAAIAANWSDGLTYMAAVLAILLTHEMGHFLFTLRYKIPASYPIFIPIPFNSIGTMGAVIGMDGLKADRKQLFDLGLAGPLAGLIVAVPILWKGIADLNLSIPGDGIQLYNPILVRWIYGYLHPGNPEPFYISINQLNPLFMAGWVGLLITGLNMLPISQLDGGHVIYSLFGKRAHTIARVFLVLAIVYIVASRASIWTLMLILVIVMGVDHPPTSDDTVELNEFRWRLGVLSLAIPILCFPIGGIKI